MNKNNKGQSFLIVIKTIFLTSGIYGLIIMLAMLLSEKQFSHENPPQLTHLEFYYGFIGVCIAFQILFILIAKNPLKYKLMMVPAILEKFSFGLVVIVMHYQKNIPNTVFVFGLIDLIFLCLFIYAFIKTRSIGVE